MSGHAGEHAHRATATVAPAPDGNRRARLALAGGAGLASLGMGLLVPILPAYALSLGASATLVGLLLSSFGIARLMVSLPSAWLAGRIGLRPVLVAAPALTAPVAAACAVVGGFWPLAAFCLLEGGTAAAYATAGAAAATTGSTPKRRGKTMTTYQAASLFGAALGPAIGGVLGQQFGLRVPFVLYAVLATGVAWWLHRALTPQTFAVAGAGVETLTAGEPGRMTPRSIALWPLWALAFVLVFARTGILLVAAPLIGAARIGLDPRGIGLTLSFGGFTALAALFPAAWLAARAGNRAVVLLAGLAMAAALVLFAVAASVTMYVAAAVLLGAAGGAAGLVPSLWLADQLSLRDRPLGVGILRTVGDAGAAIGPPLLGLVADHGQDRGALLAIAPLLAAVALLFTLRAPGWPRQDKATLPVAGNPFAS